MAFSNRYNISMRCDRIAHYIGGCLSGSLGLSTLFIYMFLLISKLYFFIKIVDWILLFSFWILNYQS